jgi:hypothetical protein
VVQDEKKVLKDHNEKEDEMKELSTNQMDDQIKKEK